LSAERFALMARFSASSALIRFREAITGALSVCCANWQMPQAPKVELMPRKT